MEGRRDLGGWLQSEMVYPLVDGQLSKYKLSPTQSNYVDWDQHVTAKPRNHQLNIVPS